MFDWCYHGTVDETLVALDADGRVVLAMARSACPLDPAVTTAVVPFNDVDALAAALAGGDIACVLAEPAMTNVGIVLPEPGLPRRAAAPDERTGTLLVLDETHTICAGPGGYTATHGLDPDLLVVGKPIGGGVPAAAYGLSARGRDVRERFDDPAIDVSGIGGTLAGNALSMAAMRAASPARCATRTSPWPSRWRHASPTAAAVIAARGLTGTCSSWAAGPSTGSGRRRPTAPRGRRRRRRRSRRSCTSTR